MHLNHTPPPPPLNKRTRIRAAADSACTLRPAVLGCGTVLVFGGAAA